MKLTLKVMLIIAAIYHILNGLLGLLAPPEWMGVAVTASTPMFLVMTMRFWGVASLALGLIAWLIRNAEASKTRDAVVLGMTFFFVLEAPVSLYGYFVDPGSPAPGICLARSSDSGRFHYRGQIEYVEKHQKGEIKCRTTIPRSHVGAVLLASPGSRWVSSREYWG